MAEIVRVHIRPGVYYDHQADDFSVSRDGLTLTRHHTDGSLGEESVAVYAPGNFQRAERLPEGAPPPKAQEFNIA